MVSRLCMEGDGRSGLARTLGEPSRARSAWAMAACAFAKRTEKTLIAPVISCLAR
jgi:hypothetical protein